MSEKLILRTEGIGRLEGVAERALKTSWEAKDTNSILQQCLAAEAAIHKEKNIKIQDGIVRKFVEGAAPVKETSALPVIVQPAVT